MIEALIAGERYPQVLADLAQARIAREDPRIARRPPRRLHRSSRGHLPGDARPHRRHGSNDRRRVAARIDDEIQPFQNVVTRLDTIPGVNVRTAQVILAEIGVDMSRFPTPGHLASWAGMCPGNHESAGKHYGGATRKADSWLRGALGEAAPGLP